MEPKRQKIVVVGAGPVGALAALYAAKRGHDVEVYEMRNDLRDPNTVPFNFTKSINLALSERGVRALQHAGYEKLVSSILADTIPMHGRMIHSIDKGGLVEESQKYDVHGRYIRASDRADLNRRLLDELEQQSNVKLLFNRKLTGCDFDKRLAWFEIRDMSKGYSKHGERPSEVEINFDLMIGADGAFSAVRFHLMKFARIQYQQEYIDTLWCEFHMPALNSHDLDTRTHQYPISPNHLHIWPGGSFMFIAIPSTNKTFTCTLFMPASFYADMDRDTSSLIPFFEKNFPGVLPNLIDAKELVKQYKENPHLPLISIKCQPYHYQSSVVILGDAAHAMVPFYGQGMNAGLEDVRVLFEVLDKYNASSARLVPAPPVTERSNRGRALPIPPPPPPPSSSSSSSPSTLASSPLLTEDEEARHAALEAYTAHRVPDAHAINDLAMGNYQEMRSDVQSPLYLLRKAFEERLDWYLPALNIATQYTRVSFSNERYSEVIESVRRQRRIFNLSAGVSTLLIGAVAAWAWRSWR